jgi:hypothetical protein
VYSDFKSFPHTKWAPFDDPQKCPKHTYFDARGLENSEVMDKLQAGDAGGKPFLFDLQNNWLKGE